MPTLIERFWAKVDKTGDCWLWTAFRRRGYGRFTVNGRMVNAHRYSFELAGGTVPDGLVLDHLCRNRSCVNPAHLEPVTSRVNTLRGLTPAAENANKTHCKRGHEFTPDNIYRQPSRPRSRSCLACLRIRDASRSSRTSPRDGDLG